MTMIEVLADAASLARAGAVHFVERANAAIAVHGQFSVALPGGPLWRAMYEQLASGELVHEVDWSRVQLYFGDERCVPPDHPASHYRMVRNALIDRAPLPRDNVHRMHGEDPPGLAALAYELDLRTFFDPPSVPRFDLVLLGMGDDGHTAALFPGLSMVHEQRNWVVACYVGGVGTWHLTLTPTVINAAAAVTFLVAGTRKAAMLNRVLAGPYRPDLLPAQLVRPCDGSLLWMLDEAAAGELARVSAS